MNLLARIDSDLKNSQKARDEVRLGTLRMLLASLKNKEIDLKRPLSEDEVLKTLASNAKQRSDSINAFNKGNRPDLANKEEAELLILKEYLPKQLEESEIEKIVVQVISSMNATVADFGRVMSEVMKQTKGSISGQIVATLVKKNLK